MRILTDVSAMLPSSGHTRLNNIYKCYAAQVFQPLLFNLPEPSSTDVTVLLRNQPIDSQMRRAQKTLENLRDTECGCRQIVALLSAGFFFFLSARALILSSLLCRLY